MKKGAHFILNHIEEILCGMALSITILSTVFNIISGALFDKRFGQCEEVETSVFVWITFVGVSLGYKHGSHICIDFVVNSLPEKLRNTAEFIIKAILFSFSLVVMYFSWELIASSALKKRRLRIFLIM